MLTTSTEYKNVVALNSRHFLVKITIDDVVYTSVKGFKYKGGASSSDHITFGDTVSACIEFTLTDVPKNTTLLGKTAKPYIGLQLSESVEWIPLGVFILEQPVKSNGFLKITAYDNFTLCQKGFFTESKGQQLIGSILLEQCKKLGINYAGGDDKVTYNVDTLQGVTIQEAIGFMSAYCGKNAIMDRNGELKLIWYQDSTLTIRNDRYMSPVDMGEDDTFINRLECVTSEENKLTVGTGIGISFTCPCMTQDRLQVLYNRVKGFTYRDLKLSWKLAQPDLEAGDVVIVIDKEGIRYKLPLMSLELNCDGGCYGILQSKAKTQVQQDNPYKGPMQNKIEYTYTEVVSTKKLVADTVEAWAGNFETIDTNFLNVNKKLTASEAEIETLKSTSITTVVFDAEIAKINKAIIGKLDVTDFTAVSGKVDVMEIDLNKVNTLLAGSVTTGSTQTIVLNAENTTIANALIKSAMIDSVTANKLTAGIIDASSIHFKSDSGNMDIFDNTLLIKDATRERVQIGKDATGDYNIYVWDKTGKLMFDATGVTADGIQRPIIRDDMVSPEANIDGGKINIVSLVTEINNGTTKIESSHVLYDGKSLDVAFNSIETVVTDTSESLKTLSTQFAIEQGKVSTLITESSQTKQDLTEANGNISTLQTDYSSLQQTVSGLNITVGQHTSSITKVQNDFDNLQISSRNLIKKSSFDTFDKTYWTATDVNAITTGITDPNGGKRALHFKATQANSYILLTRSKQVFPSIGVYSLSIWLRGNKTGKVDVTLNSSSAHPTGKYITCDVTTIWQKFTLTCDVDNLSLLYDFVIGGYNSWTDLSFELDIAFPMIVASNKPSEWMPNPEDVETEIKTVSDKQVTFDASLNEIIGKVSKVENVTTSNTNSITGLTTTVNETKTAVNDMKLDYDGFKVSVSKTYTTKTEFSEGDELNRALGLMATGKLVEQDPMFKKGVNGVFVYNNLNNGNVTVNRVTRPSDCPTISTHCVQIRHTGVGNPGLGGFVQPIISRANAKFVIKYLIKLPVGYELVKASNNMGNGFTDKFVTSTAGTGKWEEYVRIVNCGVSGTFARGGYVYVTGKTPTQSAPLVWHLGAIYQYDVTDANDVYIKFDEYSTTTQMNSAIEQKTNEIKLSAEQNEVNQYYYQNGVGNLFSNCIRVLTSNNETVEDMVFEGDIAKLKGKDISISVDVTYKGFTGHFICGFSVTYTNNQTKRYEFKLSPHAKLLPHQLAHGKSLSYSGRLSNTMTLDNVDIRSVSNLDMRIDGTGTEFRMWNPKVEIGSPTGLTQALSGINTKVEKASLAISPQQILGTISSAIDGGNSISTIAMLLNKEGLTIYNGAFKILNSGGDKVLYADLDGNLTIKGKIYATEGDFSGHITYAQIDGANINISQDARIGNILYLGSSTDKSAYRYISLNGGTIVPNSDVTGDVIYYRQHQVGMHAVSRCGIEAGTSVGGCGIAADASSGSNVYITAQRLISTVGLTVSSDRRLKDDIQDVDVSWINDLHIKKYVYKNMTDTSQIGIIAQDYIDKEYAKYFLEYDEASGYYGISYGNINNALIQYCQELNIRVQQLEAVIKQRSGDNG